MLEKFFYDYGFTVASHPWEVIVFTLTLTFSILCMGNPLGNNSICVWTKSCATIDFDKHSYLVFMTLMRCMAVLYIYYQFRSLCKLGSKYLLGIAGLFTVFSSFVFSSSVINFLQGDFAELNEALPFFFLLIDLPKASLLAQFALTSSNQKEVRDNIARGLALLGPTITLDTIVEALVIGVGPLSGVKRLEVMCCFACLSILVNYFVFVSFYPACLSLVLELSRDGNESSPVWQISAIARSLQEEEQKPNLVLQRVKIIMSAGLLLVHFQSRWPVIAELHTSPEIKKPDHNNSLITDDSILTRWLRINPDQVIMFILALSLAIKYIFFESQNNEEILTPGFSERPDGSSSTITCTSSSNLSCKDKKICVEAKCTQTDEIFEKEVVPVRDLDVEMPRSTEECLDILKKMGAKALSDEEIISLLFAKHIPSYQLESHLNDYQRAVVIRRKFIKAQKNLNSFEKIPFSDFDYCSVTGVCCENVVGYMPIPLGLAGPLQINGTTYFVPMATTEGCLVASTNRGCRALMKCGGAKCFVIDDFMSRGPVVEFPSAKRAVDADIWLKKEENYSIIKAAFDSTSRYARLQKLKPRVCGRLMFIRFQSTTGDAMGMNMVSKGTECALRALKEEFSDMDVVSLSGNFCTDKKPAAINWIEGRGKYVVCEATLTEKVVSEVLKTTVPAIVNANIKKNLIGSAMAGTMGGNNAQAANIVAATFIAMGQDPGQIVGSSNCMTLMEPCGPKGEDLYVNVTMPSLEVGTTGGGTSLPAQGAALDLLGVRGPCREDPSKNAKTLASVIAGTVLAGELSLMSALTVGHLVKSHMQHNRIQKPQTD